MSEKNIYQLLQEVRVAVQNKGLKKTGHNNYSDYDYFDLSDFLGAANEEFNKAGLCPMFNIVNTERTVDGEVITSQIATLTITDGVKEIVFTTPSASKAMQNGTPIQDLGAKHTYLKRYLYMNALEIAENDLVDKGVKLEKEAPKKETLATVQQIEKIKSYYPPERIEKMLLAYKVNDLSQLTVKQASDALTRAKEETNGNH